MGGAADSACNRGRLSSLGAALSSHFLLQEMVDAFFLAILNRIRLGIDRGVLSFVWPGEMKLRMIQVLVRMTRLSPKLFFQS